MASKRFLALDIGASTLKLGEFVSTGNGNLTLVNFGHASLGIDPSSEESRSPFIIAALQKLIAERRFKARRVAVSVSGQAILTRFLKLPATDEGKIRQMVSYEAAQNVPFPMEEVVWDFQVVGNKSETDLEVALVAIKSEIVEEINRCVEEAGLELEVVDVAPLAIYNAALFNYETHQGCTLVLDIGARTTNLIFIESKKVFTRTIPIAGNTITQSVAQEFEISFAEAEEMKLQQGFVGLGGAYEEPESETAARLGKIIRNVMTRLHAEAARSINFYKTQQGGTAPQRLLLSGGSSIISYAHHFFQEKMEMETECLNPFKNVLIQASTEELEKVVHSMGEVVGLGLRLVTECPIEVNLLPPVVVRKRQFRRRMPFLIASMLGVIVMVLSWWVYYWRVTQLLSQHRDAVSEEVNRLTQIQSKLTDVQKNGTSLRSQANQIQQVIAARYFWLNFFEDLQRRVPSDIWIAQLIPENNDTPIQPTAATIPMVGMRGGIVTAVPSNQKTGQQQKGITGFEILCLSLNKTSESTPYRAMNQFRDNLAGSEFFRDDVKVLYQGTPSANDWTFMFRIRVHLKTPIVY